MAWIFSAPVAAARRRQFAVKAMCRAHTKVVTRRGGRGRGHGGCCLLAWLLATLRAGAGIKGSTWQ
ncbi:hypothetical protein CaCOL14_006228 [Colletotrichum acutatum]